MKKVLLFGFIALALVITSLAYAANQPELTDKEIGERSDRLDVINDKLQQPMANQDRAALLFEKAQLMFTTFGPLYLRTPTEALLKAIQISPQERYKEFLSEVYDLYWKDRDFGEDDQISKDLSALKEKCKVILGR
jgi:hypothetical protein